MLKPIVDFDYWGLPIYNIMGLIGLVFALTIITKKEKLLRLTPVFKERVNRSFWIAGLLSLPCANIANWFLFPNIMQFPITQRITMGGFSFYYGMLGLFAVSALLLRLQKVDYKFWINEVIPSVLIFHAFGRIGCSLVGCCYGALIEPISIGSFTIDHFPAREIEALCLLIMFFIFHYGIKKHRFSLYLLTYSIIRFFIEFGRGDDRGRFIFQNFSPAQVTSICIWIALLGWVLYKLIRNLFFRVKNTGASEYLKSNKDNIDNYDSTVNSIQKPRKKRRIFKRFFVLIILSGIFTWWNPLNLNFLTYINFFVTEFIGEFSKEKSIVTQISESNGTGVFLIKSDKTINNNQKAIDLITSLDSSLNGEFAVKDILKLPSGNSLYIFNQTHKGIPVYNVGKQMVLSKNNTPLYSVGETSVCIGNAIIPATTISEQQAINIIQHYISVDVIEIVSAVKYWYYYPIYSADSAYKLVYVINAIFTDDNSSLKFSAVVDAVSGDVYDVSITGDMTNESYMSGDIQKAYTTAINLLAYDYIDIIKQVESGKLSADNEYGFYFTKSSGLKNYYTGFESDDNVQILNRVFAEIMKSKHFSKDDLTVIFNSTYEIVINSNSLNYWLFRSIMIEECSAYYLNNGMSSSDAQKWVNIIESAFDTVGIMSKNKGQGVVQLDMKDSLATTKGKIAYPGDLNVITVMQKAGLAQSYEIKSDVPVSVTVVNSRNESILTLPVYDLESFKINPTDEDETYTIFIQSGSVFYRTTETKTASNPFALKVYAASEITEDMVVNALVDAYYNLVVKPIESNITENKEVNDALKRITQAYNNENLNLFLTLIDPKSENWVEQYAQIQGMLVAFKALNSCAQSLSTSFFGKDISFDSIDRAIIAGALVFEDFSDVTMQKLLKLKGTSLRLTCYKTEKFTDNTIAHINVSIINDNTGKTLYKNDTLYLSFVERNRFDVSNVIDVPIIGSIADSATKGWFIDNNLTPEMLKKYGWDNSGNLNEPNLLEVEITTPPIIINVPEGMTERQVEFIKIQRQVLWDEFGTDYYLSNKYSNRDTYIQFCVYSDATWQYTTSALFDSLKAAGKLYLIPTDAKGTILGYCKDMTVNAPKTMIESGDKLLLIALYYDYLQKTVDSFYEMERAYATFKDNNTAENAAKFVEAYKRHDSNNYVTEELYKKVNEAFNFDWSYVWKSLWNSLKGTVMDIFLENVVDLEGVPDLIKLGKALDSYGVLFLEAAGIEKVAINRSENIQNEYDKLR